MDSVYTCHRIPIWNFKEVCFSVCLFQLICFLFVRVSLFRLLLCHSDHVCLSVDISVCISLSSSECLFVCFFLTDLLSFCELQSIVVWPENGVRSTRSLVEINLLMLKQLFTSLMEQNEEKRKESLTKTWY